MRRIDFFIAGVQKGGTTALDAMLRQHPSLQMASKKEVHFFDNESIDWAAPDYATLHKHFDWTTDGVVRGEATPIYTYWPNSMERLAAYNQDAKIIICLRHPAHRAYSHWCMEAQRQRDDLPFADAIRAGRERVGEAHRTYSYVERGFYAGQVERARSLFAQVHCLRTDSLWSNTDTELAQICDFLGVSARNVERQYTVAVDARGGNTIDTPDARYLNNLYGEDMRRLEVLTGLDLSDWFDPSFYEPMTQYP